MLTHYRYIELNPVRAGMEACTQDYYWLSYHGNVLGKASSLVVPYEEYLRLERDATERQGTQGQT